MHIFNEKKKGKFVLSFVFLISLIFLTNFISAEAINDTLHLNIQTTFSNGTIQSGTFSFAFNITENSSSTCEFPLAYNHSISQTTDSRGITSIYLPTIGSGGGNLSSLSFDKQYYLCYYRDGTLRNVSQLGRVPYSFRATQVNLSEIDIDSNLTLGNFNISASSGFFSFLGSLTNRITNIFATNADISNNLSIGGNLSVTGLYFGNGSQLTGISGSQILNNLNWINGTYGNLTYLLKTEWNATNLSYATLSVLNNGTYFNTDTFVANYTAFLNKVNWADVGNGTLVLNSALNNGTYIINSVLNNGSYFNTPSAGDISSVNTTLDYFLYNGSDSGDVYLRFNETRLNLSTYALLSVLNNGTYATWSGIGNGTVAFYNFAANNFNGSGYFNTTGQVNASTVFSDRRNLTLASLLTTNNTFAPAGAYTLTTNGTFLLKTGDTATGN